MAPHEVKYNTHRLDGDATKWAEQRQETGFEMSGGECVCVAFYNRNERELFDLYGRNNCLYGPTGQDVDAHILSILLLLDQFQWINLVGV